MVKATIALLALWEQNGWPRPEFKEQFNPERNFLTLDYNVPTENALQKTENHEQEYCDVNSNNCDGNGNSCNESLESDNGQQSSGIEKPQGGSEKTSQKILSLLIQDSMMTIARLSNTLNISEKAVSKQLRNLQFQGWMHLRWGSTRIQGAFDYSPLLSVCILIENKYIIL